MIGSNDLQVDFDDFQITGEFSISLDDTNDNALLSTDGSLVIDDFDAEYGNFDISSDVNINGVGDFSGTWTDNTLDISIDADLTWDIWLYSSIIGEWEAEGDIDGDLDIEANWQATPSYVEVDLHEPAIFTLLDITHDDLNLNLVDLSLPTGIIKFEWVRYEAEQEGYFLIHSELDSTISANLATISWGTKSVSIGWPDIKPGDFKFEWDIPDRFLRFRNGIEDLAPTFTYKDTSTNFELFASSGSLPHDYSKEINFIWYEDNGQISGILIDTDGTYLVELIEIGFKKGPNDGRKLAVYGISCDNFKIYKGYSGNLEWSGNLYIANHVIYSKLVSDDWKDLDVQWDFQSSEKWFKFTKDPAFDFTLELYYLEIGNYEFTAEVSFLSCDYFELKWKIGVSGKISLDTNYQSINTITFNIWNPSTQDGVEIQIGGLSANNWWVEWTAWPPEEWNLQTDGYISFFTLDIWVCDNGDWKQLPI